MKMKKFLITAIFAFVGLLAFAQERIAVFPFEDMDKVFTGNQSFMFYQEFSNAFKNRMPNRSVVERLDVERLITIEANFQLSNFSAREKTSEMNRVLNGNQILSGYIAKVDNHIRITVCLFTYPNLDRLPGGTSKSVSNITELFNIIPELVRDMQNIITVGIINTGLSLLERGISYFDRGDYDRAIFELTDAIKADPNLSLAFYYRCYSYLRRDKESDFSKASEDISQAIRLDPYNADYYYIRGKHGDSDSRIADLSQAIRLQPSNDLYYAERGDLYWGRGYYDNSYYDRAIADFSHAVRLNSHNTEAYFYRALTYKAKGDYDKAIADYSQIIELYPDFIDAQTCGSAYYNRAIVWETKKNTSQANADYAMSTEMGYFPK